MKKLGDTFYLKKNPERPYKCHVVGIVDGDQVVYKWYGRHKQRWNYEVESQFILNFVLELAERLK